MILRFQKTVLHNKTINKTRTAKNTENSAHSFGENYLTNHLARFLQNRIKSERVVALTVTPADLVTFTEEILNGKLHFLCSVSMVIDFFTKKKKS